MKPPTFDTVAAHRYFAASCFNACWPLIQKTDRTAQEAEQLIQLAHASLYHWTQREDCTAKNLSIAHWLLSRVYAVLAEPAFAQRYAESCLRISEEGAVAPYFLAFAHEAVARAAALRGDFGAVAAGLARARELSERVEDAEDRKILLDDLASVPTGPAA